MSIWLFICCFTIFAMVVLGGVTRLTGSGLSMVEWAPIMGTLPPLNEIEWLAAFDLYKQYPEFIITNSTMDLAGFKSIFWFEYSHRVLGRLIGLIFFFPMLFFFAKGWVKPDLKPKLIFMFFLGGLQGLMGWYMVKSGLVDNPHVSQYRLTAHLSLAFIVYAYIFWIALGLRFQTKPKENNMTMLASQSTWLSLFVFTTILSGGFVAGLKAGLAYNTFPLMNGKLIPDGLFVISPMWRNFFENITTVQFDHRLLATTLFFSLIVFYSMAIKKGVGSRTKKGLHFLLMMAFIQVTLGISTLLLQVPVALAASHQAGALVLFTSIIFVTHQIKHE